MVKVSYADGVGTFSERMNYHSTEELTPNIDLIDGVPANYTITAETDVGGTPLFVNGIEKVIAQPTRQKLDYNVYIVKSKGKDRRI